MEKHSRYNVGNSDAGIEDGVLKNKLGYTNQKDIDDAETLLQVNAYKHFFEIAKTQQFQFNVDFLFEIHRYFFETLYEWAGQARKVDISKGEMMFAPVKYLSDSLAELDAIIKRNLPKDEHDRDSVAQKLSVIHNEANVVHPFRDGNGRTIRLFLDVLVYSLGFNPIGYGDVDNYIAACIRGVVGEHKALQQIISEGLHKRQTDD